MTNLVKKGWNLERPAWMAREEAKRRYSLALMIEATMQTHIVIRNGFSVIILSIVKQIDDLMNGKLQAYVI